MLYQLFGVASVLVSILFGSVSDSNIMSFSNSEYTKYIRPDGRVFEFNEHICVFQEEGFGPVRHRATAVSDSSGRAVRYELEAQPRIITLTFRYCGCSRCSYWAQGALMAAAMNPAFANVCGPQPGYLCKHMEDQSEWLLEAFMTRPFDMGHGLNGKKKWDEWSIDEEIRFTAPDPVFEARHEVMFPLILAGGHAEVPISNIAGFSGCTVEDYDGGSQSNNYIYHDVFGLHSENNRLWAYGNFGGTSGLSDGLGSNDAKIIASWNGSSWDQLGNPQGMTIQSINMINIFPDKTVVAADNLLGRIYYYNGTTWSIVQANIDVKAIADYGDGQSIYVVGNFVTVDGVTANGTAIYNVFTDTWTAMGAGFDDPVNADVSNNFDNGLIKSINGDLYVLGDLGGVAGVDFTNYSAKWDKSLAQWESLGGDIAAAGTINIRAIDTSNSGVLYAAWESNPLGRVGISRLNAGGWTNVTTGDGNQVFDIAVLNNDNFFLSGSELSFNSIRPEYNSFATGILHYDNGAWKLSQYQVPNASSVRLHTHNGLLNVFGALSTSAAEPGIAIAPECKRVINPYSAEAYMRIEIDGPAIVSQISNLTTGKTIDFIPINVLTTERMIVDMSNKLKVKHIHENEPYHTRSTVITHTFGGDQSHRVIGTSDINSLTLVPGINQMAVKMEGDGSAQMYVKPRTQVPECYGGENPGYFAIAYSLVGTGPYTLDYTITHSGGDTVSEIETKAWTKMGVELARSAVESNTGQLFIDSSESEFTANFLLKTNKGVTASFDITDLAGGTSETLLVMR